MIEVEIKVLILEPNFIRKKIEEHKGSYKFSLLHEDTYYNMPKGLRDFEKTDEALRLRKSRQFNKSDPNKNQEIKYFCTYKGQKLNELTKTRNEIEIIIDNKKKMKEILDLLGFQEILTVNKQRELFEFNFKNYDIEVLVDYIPALRQYFMEVEHLTKTSEEISDSQNILFEFLSLFGIKKEESIRKSYLELILEKIKED